MLDKIPNAQEMNALIGQSLYDIWNKLCALIDEKYDGIDSYIKNVLKVNDEMIQSLRELYLEPKKASK